MCSVGVKYNDNKQFVELRTQNLHVHDDNHNNNSFIIRNMNACLPIPSLACPFSVTPCIVPLVMKSVILSIL